MFRTRFAIAAASVFAVFGLLLLGAWLVMDDPDVSVEAIELDAAQLDEPADGSEVESARVGTLAQAEDEPADNPTDGSGASSIGADRQVDALDEVSGLVTRDGSDPDDFDDLEVGRVELDFGPSSWAAAVGPIEDFDGDGNAEPLRDELDGLVGTEAEFRVRLDNDGDDGDVYAINGRTFREVTGPAPWQSADALSEDEIRSAAADAVGQGATLIDLEAEYGSAVAWEAEVVDADGREFDVLLDAEGGIIDLRQDD